jgi:hypothetical protein
MTDYKSLYAHLYALEGHPDGIQIAQGYIDGTLKGFHAALAAQGQESLARATNRFGSQALKPFTLRQADDARQTMLYRVCRKVLGADTPNYPQKIGDCVSFGGKNATEYLQCCDMLLRGVREKWRPIFPPYYYGTSRVLVGGQHDYEDGSTGSWLAEAVVKYGALFADEQGVPPYSGDIAKKWGHDGPPDNDVTFGKQHIVHGVAKISSFADLTAALTNGYPCTTASNVGYQMEASSDGFHHRGQSWSHQMCFIGFGMDPEPYAIILNNWGDVHGHLNDFTDKSEQLPVGVLRVRQKDAEAHIAAGETFAWSQYDGFPEQPLDKALFLML